MAGKPWRLKPALYTTTLVYIAVQVAFLSFLCSYYNYGIGNLTRWTLDRLDEVSLSRVILLFSFFFQPLFIKRTSFYSYLRFYSYRKRKYKIQRIFSELVYLHHDFSSIIHAIRFNGWRNSGRTPRTIWSCRSVKQLRTTLRWVLACISSFHCGFCFYILIVRA